MSPTALSAGSADTVIKVGGQQFNRNMTVVIGPAAVPTRFVSSTELDATVPASQLQNGASLTVAIYDNEGAQGGGATLSTSFLLQVTDPAPVATAVTPSSFLAGAASGSAAVTGSGLLPGTTATVDGTPRAVTYVDGSHVTVALTADDLLYATERKLVLTNAAPGGGSTDSRTLGVVNYSKKASAYTAYGDAITFGLSAEFGDAVLPLSAGEGERT